MNEEFTIKKLPNFKFRVGHVSPVEFLALKEFTDFNNFSKLKETFDFVLEHLEVYVANTWTKVKEGDIYMPVGLDKDFVALEQLVYHFLQNILLPLFVESKE